MRTKFRIQSAMLGAVALLAVVLATATPAAAQGETCAGQEATIVAEADTPTTGTDGDDIIVGTDGADWIDGGAGNDIICGGDGNDILIGGTGNDMIHGEDGRDVLRGNLGKDTLVGGKNIDRLSGGSGADRLLGNRGNDRMFGGSGPDVLLGGGGPVDRVNAGGGIDVCNDPQDTTEFSNCEEGDAATAFELKIIHINDHHSHLNPDSGDLDFAGQSTRVSFGGFPSVVTKMKELEVTAENVTKVHAGDAITGTLFYSLFKGEADAALMNEICFDIFELGNHEFDDGDAGLVNFLDDLEDSSTCDTAVLGANVVPKVGTPLAPTSPDDRVKAYEIIDYGDEKVGYIGLDIANKTKNSSSPLPTTQFLDEMTTAQTYINVLTRMGIDKIVLVTHIQFNNDMALAAGLTGVDVIVGGDSHTALGNGLASFGVTTAGDYPVKTTDAAGSPVCVVQAWQYSWVVGELDIEFDENGEVNKCDGTPHLLLGDEFLRRPPEGGDRVPVTGDDLAAIMAEIEASPELSVVTPDPAAQAVLDGYSDQVEVLEQAVIGTVTDDLCLERIPGQGRSQICDVADTAVMGGDIQQLVTEAFHIRAFESDFALQNAGGVRIDIPSGDITIADAYELLPFANTIVNLEMTGAEVQAVLEEAITFALDPDGSTGAYPYAAGLRFDVDMNAAEGSRATNHEVDVDGVWTPIDLAATYTVATNSFIASGQDGYLTFGTVTDDGRSQDTLLDYAQSFIDFIEKDAGGTLSKLPPESYSTQSFVPLAG